MTNLEKAAEEFEHSHDLQMICDNPNLDDLLDVTRNAFIAGAKYEQERAKILVEALKAVDRFGYGVSIEKNLVIRNTADMVNEALKAYQEGE